MKPSSEPKRKRKFGKCKVLTSTPNLEEIKEKEATKKEKERRKSLRAKNTKRKIQELQEDDDEEEDPYQTDGGDEDDACCLFCNDAYKRSRTGEIWIRCQQCNAWAHSECADVSKKTKIYICDICRD